MSDNLPIIPDAPPEVIGIIADRRTGKTNLMTILLHRAYQAGKPIVANYHLNFPAVLLPFTEIVNLMLGESDDRIAHLRGAYIGLDELSEGADAYKFFSKEAVQISRLASQLGKLEARVIYTETRFRKIAKRLRDQTDIFILMEKTGVKGIATFQVLDADYRKISDGVFDGRSAWELYNSNEIIT